MTLGYTLVPKGQRGWNGDWGTVPIQGPAPKPAGWEEPPRPEEIVEAEVITSWTCHACGTDQDVSGEGAVGGWMDCQHCPAQSFLVMA